MIVASFKTSRTKGKTKPAQKKRSNLLILINASDEYLSFFQSGEFSGSHGRNWFCSAELEAILSNGAMFNSHVTGRKKT